MLGLVKSQLKGNPNRQKGLGRWSDDVFDMLRRANQICWSVLSLLPKSVQSKAKIIMLTKKNAFLS